MLLKRLRLQRYSQYSENSRYVNNNCVLITPNKLQKISNSNFHFFVIMFLALSEVEVSGNKHLFERVVCCKSLSYLRLLWTRNDLRSALFWDITQRIVVIPYDVLVQPVGPIFVGQESKKRL